MKVKLINYGYMNKPLRAHDNDAGADCYSTLDYLLGPNDTVKIPLGFGLELPDGYMGLVFPRSSLSAQGIVCELPPIDSTYTGEIHAVVTNVSNDPYKINIGDRIGQLVILPCVICEFVSNLENNRGAGAFGSTGK